MILFVSIVFISRSFLLTDKQCNKDPTIKCLHQNHSVWVSTDRRFTSKAIHNSIDNGNFWLMIER